MEQGNCNNNQNNCHQDYKFKNCCSCYQYVTVARPTGPTGPTGATGATGLQGPTGASQIIGMVIVSTTSINSILTVRNPIANPTALTITPLAGGANPVSAHLVITQLQ